MKNKVQLKIILILFLSTTVFYSCRSAKDIQILLITEDMQSKYNSTDIFDIETYNKNKGEFGIYKKIQDGRIITQNYSNHTKRYSQIIKKEKELTSQLSRYYSNGKIKERGALYNNSTFRVGIWYFYDEEGNLTKTIDYDAKSKINWKKALEIAYEKYGYKPQDVILSDRGSHWMIRCEKGKHAGKGVDIDKNTGKTKLFTFQYTL